MWTIWEDRCNKVSINCFCVGFNHHGGWTHRVEMTRCRWWETEIENRPVVRGSWLGYVQRTRAWFEEKRNTCLKLKLILSLRLYYWQVIRICWSSLVWIKKLALLSKLGVIISFGFCLKRRKLVTVLVAGNKLEVFRDRDTFPFDHFGA